MNRNNRHQSWFKKVSTYTELEKETKEQLYPVLPFLSCDFDLSLFCLSNNGFHIFEDSYKLEDNAIPSIEVNYVDFTFKSVSRLLSLLDDSKLYLELDKDFVFSQAKFLISIHHPWFNILFDETRFYHGVVYLKGFYIANIPEMPYGTVVTESVAKKLGMIL